MLYAIEDKRVKYMKRKPSGRLLCLLLSGILLLGSLSACAQPTEKPTKALSAELSAQAASVSAENVRTMAAQRLQPGLERTFGRIGMDAVVCGEFCWVLGSGIGDAAAQQVLAGVSLNGGETCFVPLTPPEMDAQLAAAPPQGERIGVSYRLIASDGVLPGLLRTVMYLEDTDERFCVLREEWYLSSVDEEGRIAGGVKLAAELPPEETLVYHCRAGGLVWFATEVVGNADAARRLLAFSAEDGSLHHTLELPGGYTVNAARPAGESLLQVTGYRMQAAQDGLQSAVGSDRGWLVELGDGLTVAAAFFPTVNGGYVLPADAAEADGQQTLWGYTVEGLYALDVQKNRYALHCRWQDCGIPDGLPGRVFLLQDGRILVYDRASMDEVPAFWLLEERTKTEISAVQVITLGYAQLGAAAARLQEQVRLFNAANPEVQIEPVSYDALAAAQAGGADGMALLRRSFALGTQPDILVLSGGADLDALVQKGGLMDLYPLLDTDPVLSREDFVPSVLAASETDGTLPVLIPSYMLLTAAGSAERLGTQPGWSRAEFDRLTATAAVPFYGVSGTALLQHRVFAESGRYLDRAAGSAYFDTEEFTALLQAAAGQSGQEIYYQQDPKPLFTRGESSVAVWYLNEFIDLRTLCYLFDGDVVFKGFPMDAGTGSCIYPTLQLAVTSACPAPQQAWGFVREFLLPSWQNSLSTAEGFPLRRDALAAMAYAAQQPAEEYSCPAYLDWDAMTPQQQAYWYRALTPQECGRITELIEQTTALYRYDDTVASILAEEASAFCAGVRSAEEAAQLIQNRVQTYLDEQS